MSVENLLQELEKKSGLRREELMKRIEKKILELDNLITIEGAIYLVARDLGIELPAERRKVKISSILPGTRKVSFTGRVFKISKIVEFDVGGRKGRVVNLFIGDETGYVKVPLWNDQVDYLNQRKISVGSIVQIINGFAKEGNYGEVEVSLGNFGIIRVIDKDEGLPSAEELLQKFSSFERIKIKDIRVGNFEIVGFIVKVLKSNYIYQSNGEKALILPTIIDDGTGDIRVVFFRELAEEVASTTVNEIEKLEEEKRKRFLEERVLGKEVIVQGRVKKNDIYDRLEMVATYVKPFNPTEESYKLVEELENA
ncbi:MAG: hypothetical protein ACP5F8_00480 [Candidatus Aenigmatarchaeota archaeon]